MAYLLVPIRLQQAEADLLRRWCLSLQLRLTGLTIGALFRGTQPDTMTKLKELSAQALARSNVCTIRLTPTSPRTNPANKPTSWGWGRGPTPTLHTPGNTTNKEVTT